MAIRLYNKDTGQLIGDISEAHLDSLIDQLEEESQDDHDYYLDIDTLEMLADAGVDETLLELIRPHVKEDGVEIEWRRE